MSILFTCVVLAATCKGQQFQAIVAPHAHARLSHIAPYQIQTLDKRIQLRVQLTHTSLRYRRDLFPECLITIVRNKHPL